MPRIFRYNLDWESLGLMILESTSFRSLTYFSIMLRLEAAATLLVVMSSLLLLDQMKLMKILDFILFKILLMLETWAFAFTITFLELFDPIEIISFFKRPFIVMLSLGLFFWFELLITLYILEILSAESFGNISLIFTIIIWCLGIRGSGWLGIFCQSLVFLEKIWFGQNALTWPRKNR